MKRPAILSQCQLRRLHYCNRNQQSVRFISLMSPPVHLWGQQFSIEHRGTLDESHRRRIVLKAWVTSEQFFLIWQQRQLSRQYEFPSSWCLSKRGQRLHPPLNAKYRNIHDINQESIAHPTNPGIYTLSINNASASPRVVASVFQVSSKRLTEVNDAARSNSQ